MHPPSQNASQCWVCGGTHLVLAKRSNLGHAFISTDFLITDSRYGVTGDILRCADCGFRQCSNQPDVLPFYESMEDLAYEQGRAQRFLQQQKLVKLIAHRGDGKRLLDVGAGTGMLVERAISVGYRAEGVEPSRWCQEQAAKRGLPVHLGGFPHPAAQGPYDAVTLIDVVEHVPAPIPLLSAIAKVLKPDGQLLIVTPDVGSFVAGLLGWRWWHYRVAHVGYFDRSTLRRALQASGLEVIRSGRPGWYFSADYLTERVMTYLPRGLRFAPPAWFKRVTIPLNLCDSMYVICRPTA